MPEKLTSTGKIEKSAEGWQRIMEGKDGLAAFTDKTYKGIEASDESEWESVYEDLRLQSDNFKITLGDPETAETDIESTAELEFPDLRCFEEQFPHSFLASTAEHSFVCVPEPMRRTMLGSGLLLQEMLTKHMPKIGDINDGNYSASAMDLGSRGKVTLDNVRVMLDVESLLSRFVETPQELVTLLPTLLQTCPNDVITVDDRKINVNPWEYTYLELFALAPFSFWGVSVRQRQHKSYNGNAVVRPNDAERPIDPNYVFMVSRARLNETKDREKRHGGCPALHPAFKQYELINRLGLLFKKAQEEFLRLDSSKSKR